MALDINSIVAASVKSKNVATEEYSDIGILAVTDNIYKAGTTTIDGGKIVTGSIRANQMYSNRLVNIGAYLSNGTIDETLVTMDIDLLNGSIYIA